MRHSFKLHLTMLAAVAALLLQLPSAQARNFLDSVGPADKAILDDLYNGQIIAAHPFGAQQNTGSLWKVKIEHNGRIRDAIFKPRSLGDRDGWARTPMEAAMYKLNRILGMDVVPPTAYRRNVAFFSHFFQEGALMVWVDDAHPIQNVDKKLWQPKHEPFASDLRVLQMLGKDADHENPKNIIRGRHWKDGKYRVLKVDNEASMRNGASVELHYNSAIWGQVNRFNPETYQRLKELDFNTLKGDVGEFISDDEIRAILKTRDKVVQHIDKQVNERGRDAVFFTNEEIGFNAGRGSGRVAEKKDLEKFEKMMEKKGVTVEYVAPGDKSIEGGVARTVLANDGTVTVRVARGKGMKVKMGALVEELIHVNQLQTMGRQAGGLAALHAALKKNDPKARAAKASMEAYAKGRVSLVAKSKREKKSLQKEQRKEQAKVAKNANVRAGTTNYWRGAVKPGAAATVKTPVRRPVRVPTTTH